MMGKSGVLQSMGSQRVRFHLVTEQEEQSCIECLLNAGYSTKQCQVNTVVNLSHFIHDKTEAQRG